MGQPIEVSFGTVEDVLLITADRSLTGQDGVAYGSAAAAEADPRFPGRSPFGCSPPITPSITSSWRPTRWWCAGWADGTTEPIASATGIVSDFFLYYRRAG